MDGELGYSGWDYLIFEDGFMRYLTFILCVMILAGCGTSDSQTDVQPTSTIEQTVSTPEQDATEEPTPIIFVRNTLPPTWTPAIEPELEEWVEETPAPTAQQVLSNRNDGVREEWTPVYVPTFVPECQSFTIVEPEDRFIEEESQPVITWSNFSPAILYQLRVFDEAGKDIHGVLSAENNYQIPEPVFEIAGAYGWTVTPLDGLGFPLCGEIGDYFIVGDL